MLNWLSINEKRILSAAGIEVSISKCAKLLGIKIDCKLMFHTHVKSLWKTATQKLNALSRVVYQLYLHQRKLLLNACVTVQFSYAPVAWMFHSHKENHHINRIHKRTLRVPYKDHSSSFNGFLEKDNSCNRQGKYCNNLATKIISNFID